MLLPDVCECGIKKTHSEFKKKLLSMEMPPFLICEILLLSSWKYRELRMINFLLISFPKNEQEYFQHYGKWK